MTPPVFVIADLADARPGDSIVVEGAEGRHAVAVRRMVVGERIVVVDGRGRRVTGTVAALPDRQALQLVATDVTDEPEPIVSVTVVQAIPKGDRGELAVELLTEVGVDTIIPWAAERSIGQWRGERAARSRRRWADASIAASKQARRARFPAIAEVHGLDEVSARVAGAACALVLDDEAATPIAAAAWPRTGEVVIVVGPEGGVAPDEMAALTSHGAIATRLGPTVMRTSTAGAAAAAALLARSPLWSGMEG